MGKSGIDEKTFRLSRCKHFVKFIIILFLLSFSNVAGADSGNVSAYKGALSGEWSGDVMGVSVSGIFSISISADGTVSGLFSGFASGAISGTVNAIGDITAKGSAGFSEWIGKLTIADGRLFGSGSWKGYGGEGTWNSK